MNLRHHATPESALALVGLAYFALSIHAGATFAAGVACAVVVVAGMVSLARVGGWIR